LCWLGIISAKQHGRAIFAQHRRAIKVRDVKLSGFFSTQHQPKILNVELPSSRLHKLIEYYHFCPIKRVAEKSKQH
jgi:hypothetical protein